MAESQSRDREARARRPRPWREGHRRARCATPAWRSIYTGLRQTPGADRRCRAAGGRRRHRHVDPLGRAQSHRAAADGAAQGKRARRRAGRDWRDHSRTWTCRSCMRIGVKGVFLPGTPDAGDRRRSSTADTPGRGSVARGPIRRCWPHADSAKVPQTLLLAERQRNGVSGVIRLDVCRRGHRRRRRQRRRWRPGHRAPGRRAARHRARSTSGMHREGKKAAAKWPRA